MDRQAAIAQLPPTYARLIRLLDAGNENEDLARRLRLAPEAIGPLVALARAKLDHILEPQES